MNPDHQQTTLKAASAALCAARAATRHFECPVAELARPGSGLDFAALAERLAGPGALEESTAAAVVVLLARCDDLIAEGTSIRTDWVPKACIGDDVMEWETRTRRELSAEAARVLAVAVDLRTFLEARDRLRDLVDAQAAIEVMRRARS